MDYGDLIVMILFLLLHQVIELRAEKSRKK